MAGNIKGITIEFRGDTTRLDKALRQINNETRGIDRELKQVNNALKFNPTSVELWRQKQQLLNQKINETKEKLSLLKAEQARMDAAGVDKNSEEYRKLQREIITTEDKLKTFKRQLADIGNARLRAVSEQFKQWGTQLESAGQKMRGLSMAAGIVAGAIGGLTVKTAEWADDINTMSQKYSIGTGELQKYSAAAQLVDTDVETIAKSHIKLEKAMYSAQQGGSSATAAFEALGVSYKNADGSLREGDAVWQDTIKALGTMSNETERDALAMQLMGKSASELNPLIEDGGETYKRVAETLQQYGLDFIDQETLDGANQFNDTLDTMKAVGLVTLQNLGAQLAEYLAPALQQVVEWVGKLAQWLSNLDPSVLALIAGIAGILAAAAPLLIFIGKISTGIGALMGLFAKIGPALMGPAGIVIAVVAAIIAIGVLLYKNWDTIKAKAAEIRDWVVEKWTALKEGVSHAVDALKAKVLAVWNAIKATTQAVWNAITSTVSNVVSGISSTITSVFSAVQSTVTSIWDGIRAAIQNPIETAKNLVENAINAIRGILSGSLPFPHIKLPHFSVSGRFSLDPPSIPHFSVQWYDKGGIFDSPSIIGVGEKRPEFVGALDDLRQIVREEAGLGGVTINVYASDNMNVNELALKIEQRLVQLQKQRAKAWA